MGSFALSSVVYEWDGVNGESGPWEGEGRRLRDRKGTGGRTGPDK